MSEEDKPYEGPEKRVRPTVTNEDLVEIRQLLADLTGKLTTHMALEEEYKPKVMELIDLLEKSKGAIGLIKFLAICGTPVGAFIYWIKDHVKL